MTAAGQTGVGAPTVQAGINQVTQAAAPVGASQISQFLNPYQQYVNHQEFMPGKKVGTSSKCWPDRLIGNVPNIYLYAANNPSEASLAKRRSNAVIVSHLTPPLAKAGLYKGLIELKESVVQYRELPDEDGNKKKLENLIIDQAKLVNFKDFDTIENLWLKILEFIATWL